VYKLQVQTPCMQKKSRKLETRLNLVSRVTLSDTQKNTLILQVSTSTHDSFNLQIRLRAINSPLKVIFGLKILHKTI